MTTIPITEAAARAGRSCGSCTLCCKLLGINENGEDPALDGWTKPADKWCEYCLIGKGCDIYDTKPAECTKFACGWLAGIGPADERPDKVWAVFMLVGDKEVQCHVDKRRKDVWTRDPVKGQIQMFLSQGFAVKVICGEDWRRLILPPEREAEYAQMWKDYQAGKFTPSNPPVVTPSEVIVGRAVGGKFAQAVRARQ